MRASKFWKRPERTLELLCKRLGYGIRRDAARKVYTITGRAKAWIETVRGRETLISARPKTIELPEFELLELSARALKRRLDRLAA